MAIHSIAMGFDGTDCHNMLYTPEYEKCHGIAMGLPLPYSGTPMG